MTWTMMDERHIKLKKKNGLEFLKNYFSGTAEGQCVPSFRRTRVFTGMIFVCHNEQKSLNRSMNLSKIGSFAISLIKRDTKFTYL